MHIELMLFECRLCCWSILFTGLGIAYMIYMLYHRKYKQLSSSHVYWRHGDLFDDDDDDDDDKHISVERAIFLV